MSDQDVFVGSLDDVATEIARLRAENNRLVEALIYIKDGKPGDYSAMARRALETPTFFPTDADS